MTPAVDRETVELLHQCLKLKAYGAALLCGMIDRIRTHVSEAAWRAKKRTVRYRHLWRVSAALAF